ncbi:MAG: hypothetical protein Q9201_001416 [Fulgogasparrea decipioides]
MDNQQSSLASNEYQRRSAEPSEDIGGNETSRSEGSDSKPKLHQSEIDMSTSRQDYDDLVESHEATVEENQYLLAWVTQTREELESTQQRNNELEQELQACKDDLFKMQPRARVSDSDIAQAYDNLHEQISNWMEGEIARFEAGFCRKNGHLPNFFHHGDSWVAKEILSAYPTFGGECFIRFVTQYLLQDMVFADDILLLGLDEADTALLRRIERSLDKSKPPRVIIPAVNLANTMQTSATKYKFVPTMKEVSPFKTYTLTQEDLLRSKVIDVTTAKTLKVDSPVESNGKGEIGEQILLLAPALYRQDSEYSSLLLVKKVVLVKLDKPLCKRR